MAAFRKALEERYTGEIIMTRPSIQSLEFVAFHKRDGDKRWSPCVETHPIPLGIMLPGFKESACVALPEPPTVALGEGGEEFVDAIGEGAGS